MLTYLVCLAIPSLAFLAWSRETPPQASRGSAPDEIPSPTDADVARVAALEERVLDAIVWALPEGRP